MADVLSQEQSDAAYNDVKRCLQGVFHIERESLQLIEMFGCGNFGQVHKAILRHDGQEIPCATKSLRAEFSEASMVRAISLIWRLKALRCSVRRY